MPRLSVEKKNLIIFNRFKKETGIVKQCSQYNSHIESTHFALGNLIDLS